MNRSGKQFQANWSECILDAAENASVDLPYECRSGICGQCKVKVLQGTVKMNSTDALSEREKHENWILACQAHPCSELVLDS